jgi:4-carboxymuconolactone decarboxylase
MDRDQWERGLAARKQVLGDEYVAKAMGDATDFTRDFQDVLNEYCWGGTWARPGLTFPQRSILNLGMLAALGRMHEFEIHFNGAINNGLTLDELKEVLLQIGVYCGVPAAVECFRIARRVLEERGL